MSVANTGWVSRNYNSRGLVTHNFSPHNLIRTQKGILWAVIRENVQSKYIRIYRSINNGFSWDLMWAGNFTSPGNRENGIAGLNINGPVMNLVVDEKRNRMVLFHSMYNYANSKYQIEPFIFKLTEDDVLERIDTAPGTPSAYNLIDIDMDQTVSCVAHNDDFIWLSYLSFSALKVLLIRADEPIVSAAVANLSGSNFFNIHATCVNDNNELDVIIVEDRTTNYAILHYKYSKNGNSWSTGHQLSEFTANNVHDIMLKRDSQGTLCAMWTQFINDGDDLTIYVSLSTDDGTTWSTPTAIPKTAGHGNYTDFPTGQIATRNNLIALNEGGFVVTYVRSVDSTPMCYWRRISFNSSTLSYSVGSEYELATNCTGAKFFHPTSTSLINGAEAINIRVGYTIGQGTSTVQIDNVPVTLAQKVLSEGLDTTTDSYIEDAPGPNQFAINFNILGAPNENVDYYSEGLTGSTTTKYVNAFNKVGTTIRLYKYEPNPDSYLDDRSSYYAAEEYSSKAVFNAINYQFPVNTGNEFFNSYIERDTRVLYLPPTFHLARTFTVNAGQHLKRTVWLAAFDGNFYELSQVLPFFLNSEIAYYKTNAYVVGPGNDPFSKIILPSET